MTKKLPVSPVHPRYQLLVYYGMNSNLSSRQRIRKMGISLALIHELALMCNVDGVDSEMAAITALRLTFSGPAPRDWYRSTEKIFWDLTHEPITEFYSDPVYLLTVFTHEEPLTHDEFI
jgi:hypothetical protein